MTPAASRRPSGALGARKPGGGKWCPPRATRSLRPRRPPFPCPSKTYATAERRRAPRPSSASGGACQKGSAAGAAEVVLPRGRRAAEQLLALCGKLDQALAGDGSGGGDELTALARSPGKWCAKALPYAAGHGQSGGPAKPCCCCRTSMPRSSFSPRGCPPWYAASRRCALPRRPPHPRRPQASSAATVIEAGGANVGRHGGHPLAAGWKPWAAQCPGGTPSRAQMKPGGPATIGQECGPCGPRWSLSSSGPADPVNGLVMEASGLRLPLRSGCLVQARGLASSEAEVVG